MATKYDVNGKTPINAWIPSRDTAGNGTTTLTDLVGSSNGTLTNMDPATDWVVDTGAGGIRALDLDGSNDYIDVGAPSIGTSYAISIWCKTTTLTGSNVCASYRSTTDLLPVLFQVGQNGQAFVFVVRDGGGNILGLTGANVIAANQWHHVVASRNGNSCAIFVDGAPYASGSQTFVTFSANSMNLGATVTGTSDRSVFWPGRLGDTRLFAQHLIEADAAYLWGGGEGRGIIRPTGNIRRRQEESMMMASRSGL